METNGKRIVNTPYALYMALVAGATMMSDLDYSELEPTQADAVIVLAKQTKQDHDLLSQDELEDEIADLTGGETRDELYNKVSLLEGNLEGMRDRANAAERKLEIATRGQGAILGFLTSSLRGREVYRDLVQGGNQNDLVALADTASQVLGGQDRMIEKSLKALNEVEGEKAKAKEDLLLILSAMGVPSQVARVVTVDVLCEALHTMLCHEHGKLVVDGKAGEEGQGRSDLVKEQVLAAIETVKAQHPDQTMAAKGRRELRQGGIGALIEALFGSMAGNGGPAPGPRRPTRDAFASGMEQAFAEMFGGGRPPRSPFGGRSPFAGFGGRSPRNGDPVDSLKSLFGGGVSVKVIGDKSDSVEGTQDPSSEAQETSDAPKADDFFEGIDTKNMSESQKEHLRECEDCRGEARREQAAQKTEAAAPTLES